MISYIVLSIWKIIAPKGERRVKKIFYAIIYCDMRKKPHNNNINANVSCKICEIFTIFFFHQRENGNLRIQSVFNDLFHSKKRSWKDGKKGKKIKRYDTSIVKSLWCWVIKFNIENSFHLSFINLIKLFQFLFTLEYFHQDFDLIWVVLIDI